MVPRDDGHPMTVDIQVTLGDAIGVLGDSLAGLPGDGDLLLFGGLLIVHDHDINVQVHAAIIASIRRLVVAELLVAVLAGPRRLFQC